MRDRFAPSALLIVLAFLGLFVNLGYIPNIPIIPSAKAGPGGSLAILGMWNATKKSNADFDTTVTAGKFFQIDVNTTNAGALIQAEIGLNWTGTASPGLVVTKVAWDSTNGLTGGIFDCASRGCGDSALKSQNATTFIDYVLQDTSLTIPSGTGQVMRITFKVLTAGSYNLHVNKGSILYAPSPILYNTIDGYFSDVSGSDNYSVSSSLKNLIVLRTVSGTNLTAPAATITFTLIAVAHPTTLTVLGLPRASQAVPTATSCTPTCTIGLQIQVNGGLASASTTTPSGNYTIQIVGNASAVGGFLMKYTTAFLVVRPPHPPTFAVVAGVCPGPTAVYPNSCGSTTRFEQAAGGFTLINLQTYLTCAGCPNENVSWTSNVGNKAGALYTIAPGAGKGFPFSSVMNVSTPADTFQFGSIPFNVTATTSPIYSEVQQRVSLTLTIDVLLLYTPFENITKNMANTQPGLPPLASPIKVDVVTNNTTTGTLSNIPVNATAKVALQNDPLLKFVDANSNKHWDAGERVVYDTNRDGLYQTRIPTSASEPVILGPAPANNTVLRYDFNITFADLHYSGTWTGKTTGLPTGDPVAYDTNGNGLYDKNEPLINGTILSGILAGTSVSAGLTTTPCNPCTITSLAAGASIRVTFNWDPGASSLLRGRYVVVGFSGLGTPDNRGVVQFTMKTRGDVSSDCAVDLSDIIQVTSIWQSTPTSPTSSFGWNPNADLNNDGKIDLTDLISVSGNIQGFLQSC